jgi:GT2 family glycosyltransferase
VRASFVILNFNRKQELLTTLSKIQGLIENNNDYEIVVVDNNSVDGTVEAVKKNYPGVILIERKVNNGIAGWNDGFASAKGKYLIVLDDDSHLESGLDDALSYLEANPQIGILALKITGGVFETTAKSKWFDKQDAGGFIGCGAVIKQEVYQKIGGFADWLHVYTHEYEYSMRCLDAGFKIIYFENAKVVHRTSAVNRTNKRLRIFSARNEMAIVYKYFRKNRLTYLFRIWINNMKLIQKDGIKTAYYIILAGFEFLKIRKTIKHTPVSIEAENFLKNYLWSIQPILSNLKKRFNISN